VEAHSITLSLNT